MPHVLGDGVNYFQELTNAMTMLAEHPKTLFVGQAVAYGGQRAHATFAGVPMEKRIEMPICEDFTVGFCTGLALEGYIPICFIPRWDFLILAANQIVNHLDKIPLLGGFRPKVIIRTAVGATKPIDPGPQHTQNYSAAFSLMLHTMSVMDLTGERFIKQAYERALHSERSSIIVERMEFY